MNKKKVFVICVVCVVFAILLVLLYSAVNIKNMVVGVWTGDYTFDGKQIVQALILKSDGTYRYVTFVDGYMSTLEEGEYTIDMFKVKCKLPRTGAGELHYQYSFGKLKGKMLNGSYYLYKDE